MGTLTCALVVGSESRHQHAICDRRQWDARGGERHPRGGTTAPHTQRETAPAVLDAEPAAINPKPQTLNPESQTLTPVLQARKRGLTMAVVGVPKTIDNDILLMDKSFGFDTAVEEAQRAIHAAYIEVTPPRASDSRVVGIGFMMQVDEAG